MIKKTLLETFLMTPSILLLTAAFLWGIIHFLFRHFNPDNRCLKNWEIIYLLLGFLGVVSLALEIKKTRYSFGLEYTEYFIKEQINRLDLLKKGFCIELVKSEYSPIDFDDRQSDQDLLCNWAKQIEIPSDTLKYIMKTDLDTININNFKTDFANSLIHDYNSRASTINRSIAEYRQQKKEAVSELPFTLKILSIPFLILALSLRLAITTYNIHLLKKEKDL